MSDQPPEDWQDIDSEWDDVDMQRTPVKSPPALAAEREHAPDPAPEDEDGFEEDADTVFDGDQPTVDYLISEVPDHVAEFLDEGSGGPAVPSEVIVPLPAPGQPDAPDTASEPLFAPGSDPSPWPAPDAAPQPDAAGEPLFVPGSDPVAEPTPDAAPQPDAASEPLFVPGSNPVPGPAPDAAPQPDAALDTLPTNARTVTVLLLLGLLLATAGVVYVALYG